ncbi:MAG: hypothetical protein IKQ47_05450 [Prevotella sp.]|nr:hypothetical protein [Prevotella sp.]MBR4379485.1 hypothetical protein [Prevotella sp.]
MKKFLSIALCMLAVFACATFVSCGDDDNSNDNAAVVTPEKQSTTDSPVYWTTDASFTATKVTILEFKTNSIVVNRQYKNGTLNYSGQYTFAINGSTISITGEFDGKTQTVEATIKSWTDTQLVIDMGKETETYTKVTSIPYSDK